MSLTKGASDTSLFDAAASEGSKNKKDSVLSGTANRTISKKSSSATSTSGHPPKASLAYKMEMNNRLKQAVKDLENLESTELESDDEEEMEVDDEDADTITPTSSSQKSTGNSKKESLDKTKPRPDYIELMYGKPQTKNKRKTFMPKPALIK